MDKDFTKEYATALFDLSLETKNIEIVKDQLMKVSDVIEDNKEFYKLMTHPRVSKDEKKKIIDKIGKGLDESVVHFLYVIIDNNRFSFIKYMKDAFIKLYNEYKKVIHVKAVTSMELDSDQIEKITSKLEVKYRHKIELENVIDTSIIAGMRLVINNQVIDQSLKTQFNNLKSYILKQT